MEITDEMIMNEISEILKTVEKYPMSFNHDRIKQTKESVKTVLKNSVTTVILAEYSQGLRHLIATEFILNYINSVLKVSSISIFRLSCTNFMENIYTELTNFTYCELITIFPQLKEITDELLIYYSEKCEQINNR